MAIVFTFLKDANYDNLSKKDVTSRDMSLSVHKL